MVIMVYPADHRTCNIGHTCNIKKAGAELINVQHWSTLCNTAQTLLPPSNPLLKSTIFNKTTCRVA